MSIAQISSSLPFCTSENLACRPCKVINLVERTSRKIVRTDGPILSLVHVCTAACGGDSRTNIACQSKVRHATNIQTPQRTLFKHSI